MISPSISSKLPWVGTNIFTVMSALARQNNAINLSQGFPDFSCDPLLTDYVSRAMKEGYNQYAPMPGLPALCEEISQMIKEIYDYSYDPATEITITCGASEALYCAIAAVVRPGDEVIVLEPAYDLYLPAIELSGGIPVRYALKPPDYRINWEEVKKLVSPRTRVIMLNTPHNPTGSILYPEDLRQLSALLSHTDIFIISDEVYEHIIFDGNIHQSMARYPDLAARSFIVSSFGKSLHATGWKVGYCLAPAPLSAELRKIHQFVGFSTSTPFQQGIAGYLRDERSKIMEIKTFYQRKRDLFLQLMQGSRFRPIASRGTYFQLMSYEEISDESEMAFAQRLTIESGVACIPVSVFYRHRVENKVVRFCFAKEDLTLERAAEKLIKL
ncbi:MAG: methionine aminotransferase [Bacteroidia bacterium]|nr:methionine aminotransferase [Bacteroidia bacterium]